MQLTAARLAVIIEMVTANMAAWRDWHFFGLVAGWKCERNTCTVPDWNRIAKNICFKYLLGSMKMMHEPFFVSVKTSLLTAEKDAKWQSDDGVLFFTSVYRLQVRFWKCSASVSLGHCVRPIRFFVISNCLADGPSPSNPFSFQRHAFLSGWKKKIVNISQRFCFPLLLLG